MAKTAQISLRVEGMTCNNCALGVTKKLEKMGLEEVNTSFSTAEVSFSPSKTVELENIKSAIEGLGFQVVEDEEVQSTPTISKLEWKFYASLFLTLPLFSAMFLPSSWIVHNPWVQLGLCIPVVLIGLEHFGKSAWGSLRNTMPNMDVLIFIGFTTAFGYSLAGMLLFDAADDIHRHLFFETAATVITLVLLGNVLEHRSVQQTTTALRELTALQQVKAKVIESHGDHEHVHEIEASKVRQGQLLQVNTGDQIPADAVIVDGNATLDEAMISGESTPVQKDQGQEVIGGTILLDGNLRVKAVRVGEQTVLSGIIRLVKQAQNDKPPIQRLGDQVSAIFVPTVVSIAVATFLLAWLAFDVSLQKAIMQSIAVLVISCPCAMGLATPTAVIAGIGRGAKLGILVRGGTTLEALASTKRVVFDKTGTLTTGRFDVANFKVNGIEEQHAKAVILALEQHSSHPIATSLAKVFAAEVDPAELLDVNEQRGTGMTGNDKKGNFWQFGSGKQLTTEDAAHLLLLKNEHVVAEVEIQDEIKPQAKALISWLNANRIRTTLLSGDLQHKCDAVAQELGIDEVYAEQLPAQKLALIEAFTKQEKVAMVGDGINDAPALAKADVGISLGDATQVAIQSSEIVILDGSNLLQLKQAILISQHTLLTIKQNLFWAFAYNIVAIPIAAIGLLNPMVAALSMAFSDVIVVGNSIRLKSKKIQ